MEPWSTAAGPQKMDVATFKGGVAGGQSGQGRRAPREIGVSTAYPVVTLEGSS